MCCGATMGVAAPYVGTDTAGVVIGAYWLSNCIWAACGQPKLAVFVAVAVQGCFGIAPIEGCATDGCAIAFNRVS